MRNVKVMKVDLLKVVLENKEKHIAAYNEAVEDYKAIVIKLAKANLKLANTGDLNEIAKIRNLPMAPVSYEKEYDRSLRMLELCCEIEINVEETEFNQLVLDEWNWKNSFALMASTYKSM